jgi:hypothetical protein
VISAPRIRRLAIVSAFACVLLAPAVSGAADARPLSEDYGLVPPTTSASSQDPSSPAARTSGPAATASAPALDLNNPDRRAIEAALAQERYYSSYGDPEPLTVPQSPARSSDTPWLPIALAIAATLAITAASATHLRRLRIRRRRAARAAT